MFNIKCDDDFLKKNIIDLFEQRDFFPSLHFSDQYFFTILIVKSENCLEFIIDDRKIKFNLPKIFNEIFENFFNIISNIPIVLKDNHYYPFKQLIKNNHSNTFLTDIQNTIMCNLLINSEKGIDKIDLIKTVWPNDKEIFLNKLDTHLTNLKKILFNDIGYDLKFSSKSGIIKLAID